jgi:hypothetical protein
MVPSGRPPPKQIGMVNPTEGGQTSTRIEPQKLNPNRATKTQQKSSRKNSTKIEPMKILHHVSKISKIP